jgi:outer membrane receptor protein involved in Fe transport
MLERVPGVVTSQHSGEGKANQYYVRGFNIDHGTDLAVSVAGVPVNLPTHAHGQGWADVNFLVPELVSGIQYKKGPYHPEEGDFSSAGAMNVSYVSFLDAPLVRLEAGEEGYRRALLAASPKVGGGYLLGALELFHNDGPWEKPDDYRKVNAVLRYTRGGVRDTFSLTGMAYDGRWSATDQIPERAVESGLLARFGAIDTSDGGMSHRYTAAAEWQRSGGDSLSRASAYAIDCSLNLFSNFTYFLDDPVNGDQFEQEDRRFVTGLKASHQWAARLGTREMENVLGIQVRNDDIDNVGLYLTRARQRRATVRQDAVTQTSLSAYGQASVRWTGKLRTAIGLRGDVYRFDVAGDEPANSGRERASRVSPKLTVTLGPWARTELYVNAGYGFHSNDGRGTTLSVDPRTGDPASRVDALVEARGGELGVRTFALDNLHATLALWSLDIASELLFVGDAGTTEAGRPSRRRGFELGADWTPRPWLAVDLNAAYSRGRFRDADPAGDRIPGAIEGVLALGAAIDSGPWAGSLRLRYFGPRPLVEDDSVRSKSSTTVNAALAYRLTPRWRLSAGVFNLLGAKASDIDYFYTSRLPGEPAAGVDDIHFHPIEPRSVRVGLTATF